MTIDDLEGFQSISIMQNVTDGIKMMSYINLMSWRHKVIMSVRYEFQLTARRYIIMTTSDIIYFSKMFHPLMTLTFTQDGTLIHRYLLWTSQLPRPPYDKGNINLEYFWKVDNLHVTSKCRVSREGNKTSLNQFVWLLNFVGIVGEF